MALDLNGDERPIDAGLLVDLIRAVNGGRFVATREEAVELLETALAVHRSDGKIEGRHDAYESAERILAGEVKGVTHVDRLDEDEARRRHEQN
jgi:hypothetical protein